MNIEDENGMVLWSNGNEVEGTSISTEIHFDDTTWKLNRISFVEWGKNSKIQWIVGLSAYASLSILILGSIFIFMYNNRKLKSTVKKKTQDLILRSAKLEVEVNMRKRSEEMLKDEKDRAKLYLDILSHDIGNLHQGLLVNLQLLEQGMVKGEMEKMILPSSIDLMKRSIQLVNNVKILSYLKDSEQPIQAVNLENVIHLSIEEVSKTYMERKPRIVLKGTDDKMGIIADAVVDQVFINLISNAVKAQEDKVPVVTIDVIKDEHFTKVKISDRGPGIPDDLKKVLLNATDMKGRRDRTNGIGLSIVTALMRRYNGRISIQDRVKGNRKKGTSFILEFRNS